MKPAPALSDEVLHEMACTHDGRAAMLVALESLRTTATRAMREVERIETVLAETRKTLS